MRAMGGLGCAALACCVVVASGCGGSAGSGPKTASAIVSSARETASLAPAPTDPPLTPAPPAKPSLLQIIDLQGLLRGMTAGTSVSLSAETVLAVGAFPYARADGRLVIVGTAGSQKSLLAWPVASTPKLESTTAEPALAERGWSSIGVARCAWHEGGAHGVVACGDTDTLASAGNAALAALARPATAANELELSFDEIVRAAGASDLRGDVPNRVDAWLKPTSLDANVPLRLALDDLGFELAERLRAALSDLGTGAVRATYDERGAEHYELAFEPAADSVLGGAVAHARSVRVPKSVLQLPFETPGVLYAHSSLLAAFFGPGRRALGLLAQVKGEDAAGSLARALEGVLNQCVTSDRVVYLADGTLPKVHEKSKQPASEREQTPKKKAGASAAEETFFTLYGFEDPTGQCGAALGALAHAYAAAADSKQPAAERSFELLSPTLLTPKADWIVRMGTGSEVGVYASVHGDGWTQILKAASNVELKAALTSLATARAKHHTLASRPELAQLSEHDALLGGFVSEKTVRSSFALMPWLAPKEGSDERIALSLSHEQGSGFALKGELAPEKGRVVAAQQLESLFDHLDWAMLDAPQKAALVQVFDASCRAGYGAACNGLGVRYGDGRQIEKDTARAHELLTRGCDTDWPMACANLAFYGSAPSEVLPLLKKSCDLHGATGCAWYGARLITSKKSEEHAEAIPKLEYACDSGSGFGCNQLAYAYREGVGIGKDLEKAADLSYRACELRYGAGCIWLGNALADGVGRKQNPAAALEAYKAGCALEKRDGCYALAVAYLSGIGTQKDIPSAKRELSTACDAGHAEACRVLANLTEGP